MYEKCFYLCVKKTSLSFPLVIPEKSPCTWNCRDFFIPRAPWGQPELQSPKSCSLSCDDWQTISFSFNQRTSPTASDQLCLLRLSPPGAGIINGNWSISGHYGALWTFFRGTTNIASFAGGLCEALCDYHIWYFWWITARISAAGEQCSHWSIQTGFVLSIMQSERMLHPFKSS